ncbi:MAG: carboxylesterase [Calditrichia bacterium]
MHGIHPLIYIEMMSDLKKKKYLPGSEPIFLEGNNLGFLFVHGFTGGPYEGAEIARRLHKEFNCTVSVPLLPGHGTQPSDLKSVSWPQWIETVRIAYFQLKATCNKVVVCGLSMGGALALHLAAHQPVDAVISLAGAAFIKDWRLKLLPLARHIVPYQYKSKGPDIRDQSAKQKIVSYHKYPVKSVDQLLALLQHVRGDLPEVSVPALLIHSKKDRTIHVSNLDYIAANIRSKIKKMLILENSYHIVTVDVEKTQVFEAITQFIREFVINKSE